MKNKSEIRKDYLLDKYVIISPKRSLRPRNLKIESTILEQPSPFTPDHLNKRNIIDSLGTGNNKVSVVKNIFPAVTPNNAKAYGFQEIVIETPSSSKQLVDLGVAQIKRVLEMYGRRTKALARHRKISHILCFKNEGSKAGASLYHAHSQIFATELMPPETAAAEKKTNEYREKTGRSFYADLIEKEMKTARRVYEDKHIAVFTPYASFYHYEVWLLSKRSVDNISDLNDRELSAFAQSLETVLKTLKKMGLQYNFFCHQIIADQHEHFALKVEPRDSVWAGVELGSGLVINSVTPEEAAIMYRKNFKKS